MASSGEGRVCAGEKGVEVVTDYAQLIEALLEMDLDEDTRRRVVRAKSYDDNGVVIPGETRAWLRRVWESMKPTLCDFLQDDTSCAWLSRKESPGQKAGCPFYVRGDDPKKCRGYKPASHHAVRKKNVVHIRRV